MSEYALHSYGDRNALAAQLADDIAGQLNDAISKRGQAIIALSGGSTPKAMLAELSQRSVDWSKVVITLVDERCVDQEHELSNAAMLSTCFLNHLPEGWVFVSLFTKEVTKEITKADNYNEQRSETLNQYCEVTDSVADAPAKFDVVILGMGDDGHTASFFPDADNIEQLLDINSTEKLMTCDSPTTQVPRITWSLPMLLDSQMLALHITGENKRQVLEKALANDNKLEMPIRAAIFQKASSNKASSNNERPLEIYYAP